MSQLTCKYLVNIQLRNELFSTILFSKYFSFPEDRRRSNVVKEVEKLKENREKRRAQQAQILEEQETLRNKDPNDPNWEF